MFATLNLRRLLWVIPFLMIALLSGCGSPSEVPGAEDETEVPLMRKIEESVAVDGSTLGYPVPPLDVSGVEVHLAHDGTNLYVHARAVSEGWIAVGFNQKGGNMDGANMVLGFVDDRGEAIVRNDLGRGTTHSEVGEPGIVDALVLQDGIFMQLEFTYPMVFPEGAAFKVDGLESGHIYSLITATNTQSGDMSRPHSSRGKIDFKVE